MDLLHRQIPEQFIILDIETTGLDDDWDEIVEIGALLVKTTNQVKELTYFDELVEISNQPKESSNSKEISSYHTYVYSGVDIDDEVTALNGISNDLLDDKGIEIEDAIDELIDFICDHPIITYNRLFLNTFLNEPLEFSDIELNNDITCLQSQLKLIINNTEDFSLGSMANYFQLNETHDFSALKDCRLVLKLLNKLV